MPNLVQRIAESDATAPVKAYNKYIASNPWVEMGALGGGGALAGYYGTDLLLKHFLARSGDPARRKMLSKIMAVLGGAAGTAYGYQKHVDPTNPLASLKPGYWDENPQALADLRARNKARIEKAEFKSERLPRFTWGRQTKDLGSGANIIPYEARQLLPQQVIDLGAFGANPIGAMQKENSFTDAFQGKSVPVMTSLNLINNDPFLTLGEKDQVNGYIVGANNGYPVGKTSGQSLMSTAMKAGIGFGASYLFGKGVGSLLALPEDTTKKLSQVGGIAGAIYNSGILR